MKKATRRKKTAQLKAVFTRFFFFWSFLNASADSVRPGIVVLCVFTTVSNSNLTQMKSVQIQNTVYTVSLTTTARIEGAKKRELHSEMC